MCQKLCDTIGSYLVHVTLESKHLEQLLLQFDEWRKTSKEISVLSSVYDFLLTPIFQKSTLLSKKTITLRTCMHAHLFWDFFKYFLLDKKYFFYVQKVLCYTLHVYLGLNGYLGSLLPP